MTNRRKQTALSKELLEAINVGREQIGFWDYEVIRAARKAKGLTLEQVAEKVGCTQGFLSRFENGDKHPSPHLLEKILKLLELGFYQYAALPGEELVLEGYSESHKERIEKRNARNKKLAEELDLVRSLTRVRMLSAIILTALRDKGYRAHARLAGAEQDSGPEILLIDVDGVSGEKFTIKLGDRK